MPNTTAVPAPPSSAGQQKPLVELKDISKHYGGVQVLKQISLSVMPGEVQAIVGPSGAGKSTLLRCINYLEVPDSGLVTVGSITHDASYPVSHAELTALRRTVGMVFQSFNLFPHMTVLRNVCLAQERVLGRSRAEAEARAVELLTRVGLKDKLNQYPERCSGGQQQRVGIARALALDPKVMLFDEPTSALDPELGLEVLTVMRELADSGMTMVVVTHEMGFARGVADHVMVMADGAVVETGTAEQVMTDAHSERARRFLGAVRNR